MFLLRARLQRWTPLVISHNMDIPSGGHRMEFLGACQDWWPKLQTGIFGLERSLVFGASTVFASPTGLRPTVKNCCHHESILCWEPPMEASGLAQPSD